jgi:flagellar biosynthetic protein FliQ
MMNEAGVTGIVLEGLLTCALVAGPLLIAALVAGILVGLAQTVAQVNEPSISFLVKLVVVVFVAVALGPTLARQLGEYTRHCLATIESAPR